MREKLIIWLDRLLVFNVFLVIFGFGWLAVAVAGKSMGVPLGLDVWYRLWQPVFNPAIGILFLGAVGSWLIKKIGQFSQQESNKS